MLIKWNIQRGVPVVAKTSNAERARENLEGMYEWKLSYEQKAVIDTLDVGKRFIDFPWKVGSRGFGAGGRRLGRRLRRRSGEAFGGGVVDTRYQLKLKGQGERGTLALRTWWHVGRTKFVSRTSFIIRGSCCTVGKGLQGAYGRCRLSCCAVHASNAARLRADRAVCLCRFLPTRRFGLTPRRAVWPSPARSWGCERLGAASQTSDGAEDMVRSGFVRLAGAGSGTTG